MKNQLINLRIGFALVAFIVLSCNQKKDIDETSPKAFEIDLFKDDVQPIETNTALTLNEAISLSDLTIITSKVELISTSTGSRSEQEFYIYKATLDSFVKGEELFESNSENKQVDTSRFVYFYSPIVLKPILKDDSFHIFLQRNYDKKILKERYDISFSWLPNALPIVK